MYTYYIYSISNIYTYYCTVYAAVYTRNVLVNRTDAIEQLTAASENCMACNK